MIDYSKSQKYIKEFEENFKMKSEPVDFKNQSISQTSISIKEELNESNNAQNVQYQNDNSDLNDIVEFSDIKIENCENHFEGSENIVGSKKPRIEQNEDLFKEPKIEDPSIIQSSISIKEEWNEINTVQSYNSEVNNFVKLSEPKIENCENSYKESEKECPKIFVGLSKDY